MKLGKLGLAASAVVVMTLAATAWMHNARAQNFDDEGGRDRTWTTKGQTADAQGADAASQNAATDSKGSGTATHSWKAGESATDADYNRRSHSLTRATPGTGVKTPPWAAPSDTKTTANNEGTVVKTDNGWAHQGTWKGSTEEKAADHGTDTKVSGDDAATNAVSAPDTPANSGTAATAGGTPSLASPSE